MYRKPEHYPVWLRELLYDPFKNIRSVHPDTERNINTLWGIYCNYGRMNPINDLMFDMIIEQEREVIKQQEFNKAIQKVLMEYKQRIIALEKQLDKKTRTDMFWVEYD